MSGEPHDRKVRELFDLCIELAPQARRDLLDAASRLEPAAAAEARALLHAATDGSFLETPAVSLRDTDTPPDAIGPYRILERVGVGGMGVVYRARDDAAARDVALKTVAASHSAMAEAIRREIAALSRLSHPGVVRILDHGISSGTPWYAMELLEGRSLRQVATELPPATGAARDLPPELWSLLQRLCVPLAYIHGEGVVHRDLKPDNVLVTQTGQTVLLDFGLTSLFPTSSRDALSAWGRAAGTIPYAAPEQMRGDVVDPRTDIYAVGCILFELLTGAPPPAVEDGPWPPPVPGAPLAVERLLHKLLARDPEQRIGHAVALSAALAACGAGATATAPGSRPRPFLYRGRLTGRAAEMEALDRHLKDAVNGRGAIVLVEGESGSGKTRLALAMAQKAEARGLRVVSCECLHGPAGADAPVARALQPLIDALADHCRQSGAAETRRILGARAAVLAGHHPSLADVPGLSAEAAPDPLPANTALERHHFYLAQALGAFADPDGLLLIVDDLQWADELTWSFCQFLARDGGTRSAMLCVVLTCRAGEAAGIEALADSPHVARLPLGRLSEQDVAALVSDMLAAPPHSDLLAAVATRSRGNPLFVAEYLRTAAAPGTPAPSWELPLPPELEALCAHRIGMLPPEARALCELCAVIGREFDVALGAALARRLRLPWDESVDVLSRRVVIEPWGTSRLRFTHDALRAAAYGLMEPGTRRRWHHATASELEALEPARPDPSSLADHWELAGEVERARPWHLAAAHALIDQYAPRQAERHYRAVLRLGANDAEALSAGMDLAWRVLTVEGRHAEAAVVMEETAARAHALGDEVIEALTAHRLGVLYTYVGRYDDASAMLERALASHGRLGNDRARGDSWRALGKMRLLQGRPAEARALLDRALDFAHQGREPARIAGVLSNMAMYHTSLGQPDHSLRCLKEALELHRQAGDRNNVGNDLADLGAVLGSLGRTDDARAMLEEGLAIHRAIGNRRSEAIALSTLAIFAADEGDEASSEEMLAQSLAIQRAIGNRRSVAYCLSKLSDRYLARGDRAGAMEHARQAHVLFAAMEDQLGLGVVEVDMARLHRLDGDVATAATLLDAAEAHLRRVGNAGELGLCLCERAWLDRACGRDPGRALDEADEIMARAPNPRLRQKLHELGRAHPD